MKTNKTELLNFLNLLVVKGKIENKDMILNGNDKILEASLVSPLKEFCVGGKLKVEDNHLGELGIGNVNLLKSMLNNFDEEEIIAHRNENKIEFYNKNKKLCQQFCLKSPEYIKNSFSKEDFNKLLLKNEGNEFIFYKPEIEKLLKLSKSMNSSVFYFKGDKENIEMFFETNENTITYSIPKKHKEIFYVKISEKLLELFEVINTTLKDPKDEVMCSMKSDGAVILKIRNKNYEITYLLAQMTKKEGEIK